MAGHAVLEKVCDKAGVQVLEALVVEVMQLIHQVFRRDEAEVAELDAAEVIAGTLGVLASLAPELFEMIAEVDVVIADGGEFAEVSWLEVFQGEEATELIGPELIRIEQFVERTGLEVLTHEEVTKVALELVGPEGVYE